MQIKTTMRYDFTLAKIKKIQETSFGVDVEKKEPSCTVGRNANWCSHYGKQYRGSSKNLK